MTDQLQALLHIGAAGSRFPQNSRYYGTGVSAFTAPDGRVIVYLRRRFLPRADSFTLLQEHTVTEGDRQDNIAAKYLGDPEVSWRLCDANNAMNPVELTGTVGRSLRITLPEGIPG